MGTTQNKPIQIIHVDGLFDSQSEDNQLNDMEQNRNENLATKTYAYRNEKGKIVFRPRLFSVIENEVCISDTKELRCSKYIEFLFGFIKLPSSKKDSVLLYLLVIESRPVRAYPSPRLWAHFIKINKYSVLLSWCNWFLSILFFKFLVIWLRDIWVEFE